MVDRYIVEVAVTQFDGLIELSQKYTSSDKMPHKMQSNMSIHMVFTVIWNQEYMGKGEYMLDSYLAAKLIQMLKRRMYTKQLSENSKGK